MSTPTEELCTPYAEGAITHVKMCTTFYQDKLKDADNTLMTRYLAFELGVMEYFLRAMLQRHNSLDVNQSILGIAICYAAAKYGKHADSVFNTWREMLTGGSMQKERSFGFESLRCNDGEERHNSVPFLGKALQLD